MQTIFGMLESIELGALRTHWFARNISSTCNFSGSALWRLTKNIKPLVHGVVTRFSSGLQFRCGVGESESELAEQDICEGDCERRERFEVEPTAEPMQSLMICFGPRALKLLHPNTIDCIH